MGVDWGKKYCHIAWTAERFFSLSPASFLLWSAYYLLWFYIMYWHLCSAYKCGTNWWGHLMVMWWLASVLAKDHFVPADGSLVKTHSRCYWVCFAVNGSVDWLLFVYNNLVHINIRYNLIWTTKREIMTGTSCHIVMVLEGVVSRWLLIGPYQNSPPPRPHISNI